MGLTDSGFMKLKPPGISFTCRRNGVVKFDSRVFQLPPTYPAPSNAATVGNEEIPGLLTSIGEVLLELWGNAIDRTRVDGVSRLVDSLVASLSSDG